MMLQSHLIRDERVTFAALCRYGVDAFAIDIMLLLRAIQYGIHDMLCAQH